MNSPILRKARAGSVRQLSIFSEHKVGRLNELVRLLSFQNIHVLALCSMDATDSSIIRFIVDYTDRAFAILEENNFAFNAVDVIAVELDTADQLKRVTGSLVEAEINVHYVYPFLMRPNGRSGLVFRLEDNDLACEVLTHHQVKVLSESDIAR
tara:strand:- start:43322 stop:43780 length:459 start_codon:yes stop_codon:yes gene_type:complete